MPGKTSRRAVRKELDSNLASEPTPLDLVCDRSRLRPTPRLASMGALELELFDIYAAGSRDVAPAFARHETFAPRFGWFRKGFLLANGNLEAFLDDRAHLALGVGKNMARSIRYWCHATGLLEDVPLTRQRAMGSRPSAFGRLLLGNDGWDPYLEDPASLWMLHWKLVRTPSLATAWFYAFTVFPDLEFTVDGLAQSLASYTLNQYPTARTAPSSYQKDASCIARMYGETSSGDAISEETIQSPFVDLGLLRPAPDLDGKRFHRYRFEVGAKPGLTPEVVAAVCLEFAATVTPGVQTIGLSRLIAEPGSPGMVFKLGEAAMTAYLEDASRLGVGVTLADAAGLVQLAFDGRPAEIATGLLEYHFNAKHTRVSV